MHCCLTAGIGTPNCTVHRASKGQTSWPGKTWDAFQCSISGSLSPLQVLHPAFYTDQSYAFLPVCHRVRNAVWQLPDMEGATREGAHLRNELVSCFNSMQSLDLKDLNSSEPRFAAAHVQELSKPGDVKVVEASLPHQRCMKVCPVLVRVLVRLSGI